MNSSRWLQASCLTLIFTGAQVFGSQWRSAHFRAEGYREQIKSAKNFIKVEAKSAEGLGEIGFETLYKTKIEVEGEFGTLFLVANKALFKKDEIILKGSASCRLKKKEDGNKFSFELRSLPPEDSIYLSLSDAAVKSPSAKTSLGEEVMWGRSVYVDLAKKSIIWLQSVRNSKNEKLAPPQSRKF